MKHAYNVWNISEGRWTNSTLISGQVQDPNNPTPITAEKAKEIAAQLGAPYFEARVIPNKFLP